MDFAYRHRLAVRFRDCDAMGHVNHAVYFTYLEQCRLTFWREITGGPSPHTRVIIARAECDYRAPAPFGDELEVRLNVGDVGRTSFWLTYEIVNIARRSWCVTTPPHSSQCRCPTRPDHYYSDSGPTPVRPESGHGSELSLD
jgi:YbgC/YbaW family acyl-CoA thioester hydrolase